MFKIVDELGGQRQGGQDGCNGWRRDQTGGEQGSQDLPPLVMIK